MADNSSSGIVAIFAIVMVVLVGAVLAWQFGVFGGGKTEHGPKIQINTPGQTNK